MDGALKMSNTKVITSSNNLFTQKPLITSTTLQFMELEHSALYKTIIYLQCKHKMHLDSKMQSTNKLYTFTVGSNFKTM